MRKCFSSLLKFSSTITMTWYSVHSVPPYLVPLLQLVVGELRVLPQVLQHLWPQLAVLFPHVSGTGLVVSFTTTVAIALAGPFFTPVNQI